jgi:hypothetical protein|nr:MAG TPA: deoxyguanosinetriphosphate triphosphohydrolase-like protein [Caudoviricetes sp.]
MENLTLETKKSIMEDFFCHFRDRGLLQYLEAAGFYEAPASKGHHGAYKGALFDHSLQVAYELINLTDKLGLKWERKESPAIVGMLHDLCKIDAYILVNDEEVVETQTLTGEKDRVKIVTGQHYEWNRQQLLDGHGEKSCILALRYMDLTDEELMCIRYHMGAFEGEKKWDKYSAAVKKYPNVLYTHTADMIASQIKGV